MSAAAPVAAVAREAEFRASGTDLSERRRSGVSLGALIDILPTPNMTAIAWDATGAARIGALTSIATIAGDTPLAASYPGIAAAAAGLGTPQIRRLATLGGNLAQRSRCWYFRNPHVDCLKKGGTACPARAGNHLYGVAFDLGPCVAPHPSTMATALLAYDARVRTNQRPALTVKQLLGDGSNAAADHALEVGEMIEAIELPPPLAGEHAAYKRAIGRAYAEWPLVEVVARAVVENGAFQFVRLTAGGVAPVPIRLPMAEAAAQGAPVSAATIAAAARAAREGARPLPMTGYKLYLLSGLVQDLLSSARPEPEANGPA
jgi:xanthine dehydrogenase YagS FAD-binding subunit